MVTITQIANRSFIHPGPKEAKALYDIVCQAMPKLAQRPPGYDGAVAFSGFLGALSFVGSTLLRADVLNTGLSMEWFADEARHWFNQRGRSDRIEPGDIVKAALALDVQHSVSPARYPFDCSLALKLGGGEGSFKDEWRKVLERGTVRAATALPPTPGAQFVPGFVRVQGGPRW